MNDVTEVLAKIENGDPNAADQLLPLVYEELRTLASAKLANEKPGQTLQATALVHDAYLRLVDADDTRHWDSRNHFFAAAAEAMRRILVETARRKQRIRHGGDRNRVDLDISSLGDDLPIEEIISVNDALELLGETNAQAAEIVKLHYFAGLTLEETSEIQGISARSVYRLWAFARAWLRRHLGDDWKPSVGS